MNIALILISFGSVLLQALYDASKGNPHNLKSTLIVLIIWALSGLPGVFTGNYLGFLIYPTIRFCFFDYAFSFFKYGNIWYLGYTSDWDKVLKEYDPKKVLAFRLVLFIATLIFIFAL